MNNCIIFALFLLLSFVFVCWLLFVFVVLFVVVAVVVFFIFLYGVTNYLTQPIVL